jgi:hypothetical protein
VFIKVKTFTDVLTMRVFLPFNRVVASFHPIKREGQMPTFKEQFQRLCGKYNLCMSAAEANRIEALRACRQPRERPVLEAQVRHIGIPAL